MKLKLKTPRELMLMLSEAEESQNYADIFNYIDRLHATVKNYQILIDQVSDHNEHIEVSPGALG